MEYKRKNKVHSSKFNTEDIIGKRFGELVVQKFLRKKAYIRRNSYTYLCLCSCGKKVELVRSNLTTEHTRSCGCLKKIVGPKNKCWAGHGEISGRHWSSIKNHAKSRKLGFKITIKDAWKQFEKQNRKCALTGQSLVFGDSQKEGTNKTGSLDRIDSTKGYDVNNIQWVHKIVNWMKSDLSEEKFIDLCTMVAKYKGKM